jgi:predicted acyltransferase
MEIKRLISLDAFRGFTIAAMIMVNYPGTWKHVYAPLLHVEWHGITPTDLIFPFFLFIVGVAIAYAYTKRLDSGAPMKDIYIKLVTRSLKIFIVGVFLGLYPYFNFGDVRIAGVLQRIAIVFLICGFLFIKTKWKTQAITGVVILVGYWLAMTLIPVPGTGKAMLEPGQNLAAWVDSMFLPGKMWQGTWDPEGILSTFPALVTTISGMLTGTFLLGKKTWEQKVIYLMVAGFLLSIAGSVWGWVFPINKNLWTSSYVLFTSGLALMTLGALIFSVDILGYKKWASFGVIYGSNAIAVYVLADLLSYFFYTMKISGSSINNHFFELFSTGMGLGPKLVSLIYALLYVGITFIPAYILYRRKIFIKL